MHALVSLSSWKLIRSPIGISRSFIQLRSCALRMGWTCVTALISTSTESSTRRSNRRISSRTNSLYSMVTCFCAAQAEEQAKVLVRRLGKLKKLFARRYASEDEVARTESELEITRLRRKRAEAQMERLTLRSPIAGVVTEVRYGGKCAGAE